jgi:hypothetical protein
VRLHSLVAAPPTLTVPVRGSVPALGCTDTCSVVLPDPVALPTLSHGASLCAVQPQGARATTEAGRV